MRNPVFIVGSPRSGTSALVDVLRHGGYNGFLEGNFLSLLQGVDQLIEQHYKWYSSDNKRVLLSNVDKNDLKRQLFERFQTIVNSLNPQAPWFDKTGNPEMTMAIPIVRELWPSAAFIFAKRRGIENVISRLTKFPGHSFDYHCANWAKNMSVWRTIRGQIPADSFFEMEQRKMVRHPKAAARELGVFLGMSEAAMTAVANVMDTHRPQETTKGSAIRTVSLDGAGWSKEQIDTFLKHCETEMKEFGYTSDERYSVNPDVS